MAYVLPAILALGFLIVVHEAGHYVVARLCGMRVERFSIGFGPGLFKFRSKSGTIFQLAPVPFGGFVEIRGMNIAEEIDPEDREAYANRPARLRFLTIFAGPATNWLSAIVLAFLLYFAFGVKSTEHWFGVGSMTAGSASEGKLQPDDRVLAVDGKPLYLVSPEGRVDAGLLRRTVSAKRGEPVTITVLRAGKKVDVVVTPKPGSLPDCSPMVDEHGNREYLLGFRVSDQFDRVDVGVVSTLRRAFEYPVEQTVSIMTGLYQIVTGKAKAEVGGPVRIVEEFNYAFKTGFVEGIELLMVLSVYLALVNLFPLPALDGGRLVFLGYEMLTRRRPNPKIEATVHMVGVLLLFVVMVLVFYKDIARLVNPPDKAKPALVSPC
jgi:regulator of sigma E protease